MDKEAAVDKLDAGSCVKNVRSVPSQFHSCVGTTFPWPGAA